MKRIITDYLEETAKKFPDKLALTDGKRSLTFNELRIEAQKVATKLIKMKIFHKPAAIFFEQSVETVVCMLGAAYSGNFYTIIDSKMPASRIEKIFEVLEPAVILTHEKFFSNIPKTQAEFCDYQDLMNQFVDEKILNDTARRINYMDILYVLFTSGSTGVPKGVTVGQRSVMEYTDWVTNTFGVDENTIIGNQAPFYFDNSVLDIYQMVSTGATLNIIPRQKFMFPAKLLEYVANNKINFVFWVPSVLVSVANFEILNDYDISVLKKILFAGEVMPAKQLNQWRKKLPTATFANLYGPTEITVDCTYYIVNRDFSDSEVIPIGIPCREGDVIILNERNKLVTGTEQGELCVRGSSLAYGYYNNPEKTVEVFVQNPTDDYPQIIYRTGDLVHYNEYQEIIFDGRKDFQIKHMGNRIELGEIETAASAIENIHEVCCLYDKAASQIILFYVGEINFSEFIKKLSAVLPKYMIPSRCEILETMPHNANGKIDRQFLKSKFIEEK